MINGILNCGYTDNCSYNRNSVFVKTIIIMLRALSHRYFFPVFLFNLMPILHEIQLMLDSALCVCGDMSGYKVQFKTT